MKIVKGRGTIEITPYLVVIRFVMFLLIGCMNIFSSAISTFHVVCLCPLLTIGIGHVVFILTIHCPDDRMLPRA
jgi:ABC-type proline/glycine betaine transport system permease subunit